MKLNIQMKIILKVVGISSLISLIFFCFVIFFPTNLINTINDLTPNPTPRKELLYLIASIVTIGSIFFAMYTYYSDRAYKKESKVITIQNLNAEIEINLRQIDYLRKNIMEIQQLNNLPFWNFDTFFLKESRNIIRNNNLRRKIISTIANLEQLNSLLDIARNLKISTNNRKETENREVPAELFDTITDDLTIINRTIGLNINKIIIP